MQPLSQKQKQFRFTQVSEIEVFLLLESLDTNKSFGIDKIHPLLLKTAALQIYCPLTFIFNLSINQGIFPDSMKLAKVVPVLNKALILHVVIIDLSQFSLPYSVFLIS